jgi:hypothetical protein
MELGETEVDPLPRNMGEAMLNPLVDALRLAGKLPAAEMQAISLSIQAIMGPLKLSVSLAANAVIDQAFGEEAEKLKEKAAIDLAATLTDRTPEFMREVHEQAKSDAEGILNGEPYVVASEFLIDAVLGGVKSLGIKGGERVLSVVGKDGGSQPHTPLLNPPRNASNLIGGPLEHAIKVSGRFSLLGPKGGTLYRADNRGNITSYAVYDADGMIMKRVDITGRPHAGVPTPHVIEYGRNTLPDGSVRVQSPSTKAPPRKVHPEEMP